MRRRTLGMGGLAALCVAAGLAIAPVPAEAASCSTVFSGAFAQDLARRYPGVKVTAAVYDTRTGCWHHLNRGLRVGTASVIKAQVLGAVLLKAQDARRGLTSWERSKIRPMIRYSFNPETSELYGYVGSEAGMRATDRRFGVSSTTHTARFGATQSTAIDRTNVALALLYGGGGLHQSGREEAWTYMADVHPLQEWGISAGVPAGWTVAQKNGFYPSIGVGWRVGSSGFVRHDRDDQGYAITVMTEGASTQRTGIRLTEEVARRAAAGLAVGPGDSRPFDRARCVQTSSGESWRDVAARLGLSSQWAGQVRTAAGGTPSPLPGQLACSPVIRGEAISPSSAVVGRYVPVGADLDCDGTDDLLWYGPGSGADSRWAGHLDRRFRPRAMSVTGRYLPVAGDFDGDGCGDVLWYGPGTRPDFVWSGGGSFASTGVSITGLGYVPRVGDYDGDGHDDVLWYRPGSGVDWVWYGGPSRGRFASTPVTVSGAYDPVVADLDGDGADDIYWYARGAAGENLWRGTLGSRAFSPAAAGRVNGAYRPVASDHDGDGADEITWYAPGASTDFRWSGLPSSLAVTPLEVNGDYLPVPGDFDGDGHGDLAWYGPGGRTDWMWWGRADGGVTSIGMASG